MACSTGTGTAIKIPEFRFSAFDTDIVFAASAALSKLYGALQPLDLV